MEDVFLPVAFVDKSATEMALAETPAFEVLPAAEAAVIEHVATAELISLKLGEVVESDINITTSASAGKICSVLNLAHVSPYLLLNPKNFAEVLVEVAPPVMSEPEQEEEATPPVIDPVMLGVIHQRVIQQ